MAGRRRVLLPTIGALRASSPLSERSLFDFLTSTRLPVVSSLSTVIRWMSLGLATACALFGIACLSIAEDGWWSAQLPWSGALPPLVAAPLFFAAWIDWRRQRLQRAATLVIVALFALTMLANWPREPLSPAWYLYPVLSLVATTSLGVIPGLSLTLAAVSSLLLATQFHGGEPEQMPAQWVHAASLAAVTLASALAGAILNRLVFLALVAAEAQRRKNFESSRALRHREKLLRHALRVETIGELAGLVCHQLRNTFQVLMGHVTMGNLADDAERMRRLGMIEETLQQAKPLLDQLMHLAHPEEGRIAVCEVAEVVRQFHAQARLALPGSIELTCEIADGSPSAMLDRYGLVHALWNLVINARQAIQGNGTIALRCGADEQQVWIEVADTGCGMPWEVQQRIFDPYFTTKPPGQGTGLGLTAVARYVRGSNGVIQVDSEPGRGTVFRLRFPRAGAVRSRTA